MGCVALPSGGSPLSDWSLPGKPVAQVHIRQLACGPASHPVTLGCQKQQRRDENSISDLGKVSLMHNSVPFLWMVGKQQSAAPVVGFGFLFYGALRKRHGPEGLQCEWLASLLSVPCLSLLPLLCDSLSFWTLELSMALQVPSSLCFVPGLPTH